MQGIVNTYAKVKSKYCKKGVVPCKSMRKLFWLKSSISCSEMFRKRAALKFLGKRAWWRTLLSMCSNPTIDFLLLDF